MSPISRRISGGIDTPLSNVPTPGTVGSSLELLSDPRGVDFKPYLIRPWPSVKRNWMAVIPESARLGRRGRVVIQFVISSDGSVPKLVIASASGADALDRAAVAGISATNPFPRCPTIFAAMTYDCSSSSSTTCSPNEMTTPRFLIAMAAYAVLAVLAAFTLDQMPRVVVWLFLFALAVKTWIATKR